MMENNSVEDQIHTLVSTWTQVTGIELNASRLAMDGSIARFVYEGKVTPDEMKMVAKYLMWQNRQASEARYRKPLDLVRLMRDLAQFESILSLAKGHFRNNKPRTGREEILQATGRPDGLKDEPKSGPRQVSTAMIAKAIQTAGEG